MMDAIKKIEVTGDFKSDKIYSLYKTSSTEINLEILSLFQKYESSLDFFSYYTKNDIKNLLNSVDQLDENLTSVFNENSNNFSSYINKYISQISKIILTLNLIQKTQEILNNVLLKSKLYLKEISNNSKIENMNQNKLLSLMDNLQYDFSNDIPFTYSRFSVDSTNVNSCSSINSLNKTSLKKKIKLNSDNKIYDNFFNTKLIGIVNEESLSDIETPAFCGKGKKTSNTELIKKVFKDSDNNNVSNDNDLNISLRDMIFDQDSESKNKKKAPGTSKSKNRRKKGKSYRKKTLFFSEKNVFNLKHNARSLRLSRDINDHFLDEREEIKMFSDFLILIKNLYKNCLITSEEKVEIKKLIISKSRKIIKFYINEFDNIKNNNDKIATALKSLL